MKASNLIGPRILFLGAHADDIEIGCGGTAAKFTAAGRAIAFAVAADCGSGRKTEAETAATILKLSVGQDKLFFSPIPDGRLDERKEVLRNWLVDVAKRFQPDTVFVHRGDDTHPDHAALYAAAIRVLVNHSILLYPIPKLAAQATPFDPNYWEDISAFLDVKLKLCACHASQAGKGIYLDPEHLTALARVAYQSGFGHTGGYAEAFRIHVARSAADGKAGAKAAARKHVAVSPAISAKAETNTDREPARKVVPGSRSAKSRRRKTKPKAEAGHLTMNIGKVTGQVVGQQVIKGNQINRFGR